MHKNLPTSTAFQEEAHYHLLCAAVCASAVFENSETDCFGGAGVNGHFGDVHPWASSVDLCGHTPAHGAGNHRRYCNAACAVVLLRVADGRSGDVCDAVFGQNYSASTIIINSEYGSFRKRIIENKVMEYPVVAIPAEPVTECRFVSPAIVDVERLIRVIRFVSVCYEALSLSCPRNRAQY